MMQTHHFNSGSFVQELWIANKKVFANLKDVDVEFITSGAFDWVIADAAGNEVRTDRRTNPTGGWTSINLPSLGLYGDYSIGFRNVSDEEKKVKQGDVSYG